MAELAFAAGLPAGAALGFVFGGLLAFAFGALLAFAFGGLLVVAFGALGFAFVGATGCTLGCSTFARVFELVFFELVFLAAGIGRETSREPPDSRPRSVHSTPDDRKPWARLPGSMPVLALPLLACGPLQHAVATAPGLPQLLIVA